MDTPTVTLRAMTTDEFDRFWDRQSDEYVESLGASLPPEAARAKARDDRRRLLPEGLATPGHRLLTAEAEGRVVGQVWLGPPEPHVAGLVWLYEIRVDESVRGQGHGRAVLDGAERVAQADGATRLGLNVFGHDRAAIALYESAGYAVTAQQMAKPLGGD